MLFPLYLLRKCFSTSTKIFIQSLLGSTILTIFQIPAAEDDPITRTAALLSMICALMSLSYGCMYIVRFGMMRNMFYASRWAEVSFYFFAGRRTCFSSSSRRRRK
jgi:hypothetical protein